jgi:hypothetical protein
MSRLKYRYLTKKPKNDGSEDYPITQNQLFCQVTPNILKIKKSIFIVIVFLAFAQVCVGQVVGDFRSYTDGTWSSDNPWEQFNGSDWEVTEEGPGGNSNVTILAGDSIATDASLTVSNLIIDSGGKLYLYPGFRLDISGDLTINGNVTVSSGASLKVNGETNLGGSECLFLRSNNLLGTKSRTGSLISGSFSGSGTIKFERFMSKTNNWHVFSSPVSQSLHDFIKTNNQIPDLYDTNKDSLIGVGMCDYNTKLNLWNKYLHYNNEDITIPPDDMIVGKGYSIRTYNDDGKDTGYIYSTGSPDSDNDISIDLNVSGSRWNCIGNPYTSGLSVSTFLNTNTSLLQSTYLALYLWSSATSAYTPCNYSSSNIQAGQGFFVKSNSTGGNIIFNSQMQVFEPNLSFKSATTEWPSINILVHNEISSGSTEIKFVTNTTKGLDPGYDAGIFNANPDFALYSKLLVDNSEDFALQCLPDQNYDQYVIPIGIDCKVAGDITFTAETVNLPSGCRAILEDRSTNRFTRLDQKDAKYTAYVSADTKGAGRFFLHTSDVISSDQSLEKQLFKVWVIGKTVYVNGEVSDQAKFFVYSVDGKQLANFSAESQVENRFDASGFAAGIYILTVNDKFQKKSIKFVIEN